jgi:hypothetical protein
VGPGFWSAGGLTVGGLLAPEVGPNGLGPRTSPPAAAPDSSRRRPWGFLEAPCRGRRPCFAGGRPGVAPRPRARFSASGRPWLPRLGPWPAGTTAVPAVAGPVRPDQAAPLPLPGSALPPGRPPGGDPRRCFPLPLYSFPRGTPWFPLGVPRPFWAGNNPHPVAPRPPPGWNPSGLRSRLSAHHDVMASLHDTRG